MSAQTTIASHQRQARGRSFSSVDYSDLFYVLKQWTSQSCRIYLESENILSRVGWGLGAGSSCREHKMEVAKTRAKGSHPGSASSTGGS